jgi:hypothetical protein
MQWMVLTVGIVISVFSLVVAVRVDVLRQLARRVFHTSWLYAAALARLLLGALLLAAADQLAFGAALEILGWLFILGGLSLVAIPVRTLRRLADWAVSRSNGVSRLGGAMGLMLGLFLSYAAMT